MLGRQAVLGIEAGRLAAVAGGHLGPDRGIVPVQVLAAHRQRVVVGVLAAVIVEGELGQPVQFQRAAQALQVFHRAQRAGRVQGGAFGIHAPDLGTERTGVIDAPFQRGLGLGQRLGGALGTGVACVHAEVGSELALHFSAVLGDGVAGVVARDRVAGTGIAPPGAHAPVQPGPAQLLEVGARLQRFGLAFAVQAGVVLLDEAHATVVREEHRRTEGLGLGVLGLEVGALAGLQGQVARRERVVLTGAVLLHVGGAHADMVAEPVLAAEAGTDVVGFEAGGHPLVVHQQALLEAIQRRVAGEGGDVLAGDLRQRTRQQDAALQFVDIVVRPPLQHHAVLHPAGGQVADLQGHDVRTRQQIGMPQVVQAAAGADELVVARRRLGL